MLGFKKNKNFKKVLLLLNDAGWTSLGMEVETSLVIHVRLMDFLFLTNMIVLGCLIF